LFSALSFINWIFEYVLGLQLEYVHVNMFECDRMAVRQLQLGLGLFDGVVYYFKLRDGSWNDSLEFMYFYDVSSNKV